MAVPPNELISNEVASHVDDTQAAEYPPWFRYWEAKFPPKRLWPHRTFDPANASECPVEIEMTLNKSKGQIENHARLSADKDMQFDLGHADSGRCSSCEPGVGHEPPALRPGLARVLQHQHRDRSGIDRWQGQHLSDCSGDALRSTKTR